MKYLGSILILCALAAAAPARAFDVEGDKASLQDSDTQFASAIQGSNPDYTQGSSLATPFIGSGRTDSDFVSDYGNGISIPAPGVDKPAPAWALTPSYSAATALAPIH
jgi:hypothetical protein